MPRSRIALETGTHSPWVSRLLTELGHEVIVAHARNVRLIGDSSRKDDRIDARTLARLARIDPQLLRRSAKAQIHLMVIRARAGLVTARTALVNTARGLAKSYGERLRKCRTQQVGRDLGAELSAELRTVLEPLLEEVETLNGRIKEYDHRIEQIAKESYPEVSLLQQVKGVGTQDRPNLCPDHRRPTPIPKEPLLVEEIESGAELWYGCEGRGLDAWCFPSEIDDWAQQQ